MRLKGSLNISALEQSLNEIVRRHEALRTSFVMREGKPVQVIAPSMSIPLLVVDIREWQEAEQEIQLQKIINEETHRAFDLTRGALLRTKLIQLSAEEHVFVLTMHHIISDGWSIGILFKELAILYKRYSTGEFLPLPDLPIQYADFASWQRQSLQEEALDTQLNYWKKQLSGELTVLQLPTDWPRPAVQKFRGQRQPLFLPKTLADKLNNFCQQEGVTLFMTLLTAFKVLLYRYTRQEDILVGSPIANRNLAEIENLIGFFVNTLVLRTDLSGNPSFRQLLHRVREVALGAYTHQDLPFEKLVAELQPERYLTHNPLFQTMFALQNFPSPVLELPGLDSTPLPIDTQTAKFDLALELFERPEGLTGWCEYNTDLFTPDTITRMIGHFRVLLEGAVTNPDQRISHLPLLTGVEQHQLFVEWNASTTDYSYDKCIHQLFEAQVERTPDNIAVVFEDQQLSYRELNQRANQLAHYLRLLGVKPEVLVGICVERSLAMVVGILGILKAGGAYVPLDPTYPHERLSLMLEDAQTPVLLMQQSLSGKLPKHHAQVVFLDAQQQHIALHSQENPVTGVTAENVAYVIYTSGSTGKPKGVVMPHLALSNLILWQTNNSTLPSEARTMQFASFSFDVSFQEMFSAWCAGGTLVLSSDDVRKDPVALLNFLVDKAIARLFLPCVALQQLVDIADVQRPHLTNLREVITSGDQLQITQNVRNFFSRLENCIFQNQYGPSESHAMTAYTLTGSPENWPVLPSIGRPISNTQVYLLDQNLQPVPISVPGELYIGGVCLARSYLNRADLTAERFIHNPFSTQVEDRLYKTGDLARFLPDGNIEFLKRIDHQVKIRGFRVELGEIRAVLGQYPGLRKAVLTVREDTLHNKRLVAYVVLKEAQSHSVTELRHFVKDKLPDYMVPSDFVILESLPLTPNGKVDYKALPIPKTRPQIEKDFVAPRNCVEKALAEIWAEVLDLDRIGVHDSFFDLGGNSLLATQAISKVRQIFQLKLPLRVIFETSTVAEMADALIANETKRGQTEKIAQILEKIDRTQ